MELTVQVGATQLLKNMGQGIRHLAIDPSFTEVFSQEVNLLGAISGSVHSLYMRGCQLSNRDIKKICKVAWPELRWLCLANTWISKTSVKALAKATKDGMFPKLEYVDLYSTRYDPREKLSFDQGVLTYWVMPREGEFLEEKFGRLEWLHCVEDNKLKDDNRYTLSSINQDTGNELSCLTFRLFSDKTIVLWSEPLDHSHYCL